MVFLKRDVPRAPYLCMYRDPIITATTRASSFDSRELPRLSYPVRLDASHQQHKSYFDNSEVQPVPCRVELIIIKANGWTRGQTNNINSVERTVHRSPKSPDHRLTGVPSRRVAQNARTPPPGTQAPRKTWLWLHMNLHCPLTIQRHHMLGTNRTRSVPQQRITSASSYQSHRPAF